MKKLLILMLFGVLFVPMNGSAKADEVLYCQSDLANGLVQNEDGTWREASFKKTRYTIKFSNDYKKMKGLDNKILGDLSCYTLPLENVKNRYICRLQVFDAGETFIFDLESKRFIYSKVSTTTYLDTDTPIVRAGTCEKF